MGSGCGQTIWEEAGCRLCSWRMLVERPSVTSRRKGLPEPVPTRRKLRSALRLPDPQQCFFVAEVDLDIPALKVALDDALHLRMVELA